MVSPDAKRDIITYLIKRYGASERRCCSLIGLSRRAKRYVKQLNKYNDTLLKELLDLAKERPRFGCRRLYIMLRRKGYMVNHKRVYRLYKQANLKLRTKRRRKIASQSRLELPQAVKPNERWSMDFVSDALHNGRKIKVLTIVDNYTRESLATTVDFSITGAQVVKTLEKISLMRGLPESITVDNGPEFIGKDLDKWAYSRQIKLNFIRPGKPIENNYVESFNGRLRDECLNSNWFMSLYHAREIIENWRQDYNNKRPHGSLEDLTPLEFLNQKMPELLTV